MLQTTLYIEDWIGLKSLDDAGRVKYLSVPGGHLVISQSVMKKHVVPYLVDELPGSVKDEPSSIITRVSISMGQCCERSRANR